jgi:hypothetical protein
MALKFAPPGSLRVRGVQRAQLQTIRRLARAQLKFNLKEAARVPPVIYLNDLNLAAVTAMVTAATALLTQQN